MPEQRETIFMRLFKSVFRPPTLRERPAPDLDANSLVLARLQDNDPVYRMLIDHALVEFANNLTVALDPRRPAAERVSYMDRAAAVASFLDDIETRREKLRADWKKNLGERLKQRREHPED